MKYRSFFKDMHYTREASLRGFSRIYEAIIRLKPVPKSRRLNTECT